MTSIGNLPLNDLEKDVLDPSSSCYIENLLDVLSLLVEDCSSPPASESKNVKNFLNRYNEAAKKIEKMRISRSDFQQIKLIGKGGYGRVDLVRHKRTRRVYALKTMSKSHILNDAEGSYWNERNVLANIRSEWLVACHYAFMDKDCLYLCMEYLPGGNLYYWLGEKNTFTEEEARFYLAETVLALDVLHNLGFIYCDLKPENMQLDANGHLKLIDFGSCKYVGPKGYVMNSTTIGTPDYMCPEIINSQTQSTEIDRGCDLWALGVIAYEMFCGEPPFYGETLSMTFSNILDHKNWLKFPTDLDPPFSDEFASLISAFLKPNDQRLGSPTAVEAADSSLNDGAAVLEVAIAQVRDHPFFASVKWHQLRSELPPIQPTVTSETDTSNIDIDGISRSSGIGPLKLPHSKGAFARKAAQRVHIMGENLSFAGYTFNRDHIYLKSTLYSKEKSQNTGFSINGINGDLAADQSQQRLQAAKEEFEALKVKLQQLELQKAKDEVSFNDSQRRLAESVSELEAAMASRGDIEKAVTDLRSRLSASQVERDKLTSEIGQLNLQLRFFKEQEEKLAIAEEEKQDLNQKLHALQKRLEENQCKLNETLRTREAVQTSPEGDTVKQTQELIAHLDAQVEDLEKEKEEARQKVMTVVQEANNLRLIYVQQITELSDQLQAVQNRCQQYETQALETKEMLETSLANEKEMRGSLDSSVNARRQAESTILELQSAMATCSVEKRALEESLTVVKRMFADETSRLNEFAEQRLVLVTEVSAQLNEMRKRCTAAEEENVKLTEFVSKLQNERDSQQHKLQVVVAKLFQVTNDKAPSKPQCTNKKADKNMVRQMEIKLKNLQCTSQKEIAQLNAMVDQYKRELEEGYILVNTLTVSNKEKDKQLEETEALISKLYAKLEDANSFHSTPVKSTECLQDRSPSSSRHTDILAPGGEPKMDNIFTVILQSPIELPTKHRGRHKMNWSQKFAKLKPFVLSIYASCPDKDSGAVLNEEIPLYQIEHCRNATRQDLINTKEDLVLRTLQLFYRRENPESTNSDTGQQQLTVANNSGSSPTLSSRGSKGNTGSNSSLHVPGNDLRWMGHTFHAVHFRWGGVYCNVCHKTCSDLFNPPPALECTRCSMRLHREHVDKQKKFASCCGPTEMTFLRMPNVETKKQWFSHLTNLCKRLKELSNNPTELQESGLAGLAAVSGGVQNIGITATASLATARSNRLSALLAQKL